MTVKEKILELSALPSGHTVREHLLSMTTVGLADCTEAISLAVSNYKDELALREGVKVEPGVVVVQDGRTANTANGELDVKIDGDINTYDMIATLSKRVSGKVNSSSTSGSISGSISGKVKK